MRLQYIKEVEAVIILIHPELEGLVHPYSIGKNERLVYIICPVRAIKPYHKELVESIPDEEYVFLHLIRYYDTLHIPKKLITHWIFNQCLIRNDVFVLRENDLNFPYPKTVYNLALDFLKINKNRNG